MKVLSVFYYYYFVFYSKVIKDNEPHLLTTMALSFSEALLVNYSIMFIGAHVFCKYIITKWVMIGVIVAMNALNYKLLHRSGKAERIVLARPKILNSHRVSILLTILFFMVTISFLFWGSDYAYGIISRCR